MKYAVTIEETLSKMETVEAASPEEALEIVKSRYDNGEIVLDSSTFVAVAFEVDAPGPTEEFPIENNEKETDQ